MNLPPVLRQRYFDQNGVPLAGGMLYSYQAGTTTPQATYTDQSGVTPNANPIVLDSNGEASMWMDPNLSYKFVLTDSLGNVRWTVDNVVGVLIPNSVTTAALQNGAVTSAKLATQAVATSNLADGSVTAAKLASASVARASMTTGAIGKVNIATKTAAYTLTDSDDIVMCDASGGAFTVTLPAASGETGRIFTVCKKDSSINSITIARTGTDLIAGETSQTIVNQYNSIDFYSDGSNWYVK